VPSKVAHYSDKKAQSPKGKVQRNPQITLVGRMKNAALKGAPAKGVDGRAAVGGHSEIKPQINAEKRGSEQNSQIADLSFF
jgi:hypothetical protein